MKYGRLAPHPESTHPRVKLADHLTGPAPIPEIVDWASKVSAWPMYLNDTLGDCTCAGVGHMVQAWTAYAGTELTLPDSYILSLYEAVSGYDPATGANDNGAVEQDVLQYLHDTGVDGHGVVAFAQVNSSSFTEMKAALQTFGTLYLGINCPASMQQQFGAGQPIDYVPGSPIEGGHCVVIQKWDDQYMYIVTWGKLVPMTEEFWAHMGEEAWAIITKDWIEANGSSPSGLNLAGLTTQFKALQAAPSPAPTPAPAPKPVPWYLRFIDWLASLV